MPSPTPGSALVERKSMREQNTMDRRSFLRRAVTASAGLIAAPTSLTWLTTASPAAASSASDPLLPFVDHYTSNVMANLTAQSNAAVDILSGMAKVWKTGTAWNTGTPLMPDVLSANMRHCVDVTTKR